MITTILVSGKSESGKDSFYNIAKSMQTHETIVRCSFADEVKRIAREIGWNGQKDQRGITLLQSLSYCARLYDENVWLNMTHNHIISNFSDGNNWLIVITDCRYRNQISYFKERYNTVTVRVNRPGHKSKLSIDQMDHPCETELDLYQEWDYVITNNEDYSAYCTKVIDVMNHILRTIQC